MTLPEAVAALVAEQVEIGGTAQAFPFLTVDADGHPHLALLSATELDVGADGALHVALAGAGTRANLLRTGTATLLAVEGTTAHVVKLTLRRHVDHDGLFGAVLDVSSHRPDSLGIPLAPLTFEVVADLERRERWDRTRHLLHLLAS